MGSNPCICLFTASNKFIFSTHQEKPYSNGCSLLIYASRAYHTETRIYGTYGARPNLYQWRQLITNQIPSVFILMSVFNFILFSWAASYLTLAVSWVCLWQCLFWQQLNLWSFVSRGCLPNCCQLVRVLSMNTDVLCCSLGKLEMIGWLLYVT